MTTTTATEEYIVVAHSEAFCEDGQPGISSVSGSGTHLGTLYVRVVGAAPYLGHRGTVTVSDGGCRSSVDFTNLLLPIQVPGRGMATREARRALSSLALGCARKTNVVAIVQCPLKHV